MRAPFVRGSFRPQPHIGICERFGIRSPVQLAKDYAEIVREGVRGRRFQVNWRSLAILRPELALPAYVGWIPADGLAPIFNLFDRIGGGVRFRQRVSRTTCRDYRGGTLTYDEHDGTDLVCPVGTPLVAAAPGVVVMIRHRWLRGGLTVAVDHGHGLVTQYTHCSRALTELGQPVQRGEPVALSGASGVDMTQFFPWVAPHVHFMVLMRGRPVDPFLAPGEAPRAGTWLYLSALRSKHGCFAMEASPLGKDTPRPVPSPVDPQALEDIASACTDAAIHSEIAALAGNRPALAALIEDALVHDAWAFPESMMRVSVRPPGAPAPDAVQLTLPLPASEYRGMRLADTPWSAP